MAINQRRAKAIAAIKKRGALLVYSKWYQGRATFFANDVFVNLLSLMRLKLDFSHESRMALEVLEADSPLSTKQLKTAIELEGRLLEPTYNRALKPLWQRLQIVGFGEFADSSFPSLGIAASRTMFENLWNEAEGINAQQADKFLEARLGEGNLFLKFARKIAAG